MTRAGAVVQCEPTAKAVAGVRVWMESIARQAQRGGAAGGWYLLVSPLGMSARSWLEEQLDGLGVQIHARTTLVDWPRISTAVQVRGVDTAHLRRAVLYEAAWSVLFPDAAGEAWTVQPAAHPRLVAAKAALRAGVEERTVTIGALAGEHGVLHAFHLADPEAAEDEARRLEAALSLSQ